MVAVLVYRPLQLYCYCLGFILTLRWRKAQIPAHLLKSLITQYARSLPDLLAGIIKVLTMTL